MAKKNSELFNLLMSEEMKQRKGIIPVESPDLSTKIAKETYRSYCEYVTIKTNR